MSARFAEPPAHIAELLALLTRLSARFPELSKEFARMSARCSDQDELDEDMIRLLQQFMGAKRPFHAFSEHVWRPPTDVYETEEALVVKVEIAGVDKDAFRLEFSRNVLIIRGQRTQKSGISQVSYHRMEIKYGEFEVEFALPLGLDHDRTTALYREGFLTITIPKDTSTAKSVSIDIQG